MTKAKAKAKPLPVIGVGSPGILNLQLFGDVVNAAFGTTAYLVGTAARGKVWRDVDVRLILPDDLAAAYETFVVKTKKRPYHSRSHTPAWTAMAMAFSALGREMTGLPIDFQIQSMSHANTMYGNEVRVPLFTTLDRDGPYITTPAA